MLADRLLPFAQCSNYLADGAEEMTSLTRFVSETLCGLAGALFVITPVLASQEYPQSEGGALVDRDTGLRCLNQFCDYVRDPGDVHCLCKKAWPDNDRRKKVRLECFRYTFGRRSECERR